MTQDPRLCPLCGQPNHCAEAAGKAPCWCATEEIPQGQLRALPLALDGHACLCQSCLRRAQQGLIVEEPDA